MLKKTFPILLGALILITSTVSADGTKMLRYPDVHGDQVVFSYAGDL